MDPRRLADPNYVKAAPVLDDADLFDAPFFECSDRDAALMDPQHRVFLECAWEALEDAGYAGAARGRRVGVFGGAGSVMGSYLLSENHVHHELISHIGSREHIANDKDHLCTRVSYKLGLRGPGVTIQTACSTSLVAVHLACQSLLDGECEMAIAGGVTIRTPQVTGYVYRAGDIFSPDGHCRAFDASGQGTIFGSGAGVVVLKPLRRAVEDGDRIRAVIRGSAINNDGGDKFSYWATSTSGQADAIARALHAACVSPETIGYIEAHGTATRLGDLMEVSALKRAIGTGPGHSCALGSVKTNIGHLDAAAGIAGLIKAVLSLEGRELFASLHFATPNPRIDFKSGPFLVNDRWRAWEEGPFPRRAGVNSLGVGGTNAHMILEEAPVRHRAEGQSARPLHLLALSAKTDAALGMLAGRYRRHLERDRSVTPADICYTANVGRAHFERRAAMVITSAEDAIEQLAGVAGRGAGPAGPAEGLTPPRIAFIFPGQGASYAGLGRALYRSEPAFAAALDRCDAAARPLLGASLCELLFGAAAAGGPAATDRAEPALFALEYALAAAWRSWGIEPGVLVGHSLGEYAAACLAGVFEPEDAVALVAARGRLMRAAPAGAMAAVAADEGRVRRAMAGEEGVAIAAVNAPGEVVIGGPPGGVARVAAALSAAGVACRVLGVDRAFHTAGIEPALGGFERAAAGVRYAAPRPGLISAALGAAAGVEVATAGYWVEQARRPVRFEAAMRAAWAAGARAYVEVGPGSGLAGLGRRCAAAAGGGGRGGVGGGPAVGRGRVAVAAGGPGSAVCGGSGGGLGRSGGVGAAAGGAAHLSLPAQKVLARPGQAPLRCDAATPRRPDDKVPFAEGDGLRDRFQRRRMALPC